jgi:DNA primase
MNTQQPDFRGEALRYHSALPRRIRTYLQKRGIPDQEIDHHLLGWMGSRIAIPVPDATGRISQFRLAKDPLDRSDSPKMLSSPHSHATLYGWDTLQREPSRVVICEGEFDRLVLETQGFDAVTSTGGALTFRPEWTPFFLTIPEVFVCLDRDEVGHLGSERISRLLPTARVVTLPEEVGEGGDVSDFFIRLGKRPEEFEALLHDAKVPARPEIPARGFQPSTIEAKLDDRVQKAKRSIRIEDVIGRYVELQVSGSTLIGHCPFHSDDHPSLVVFQGTQTFHCFGCGEGGDVLSFLRRQLRLSFPQALDAAERLIPSDEREAA